MAKTTRALGDDAENLACEYLTERGWEILDRNYYYGKAEIDIIAKNENCVAFVEVKMRSGTQFGHPIEFVNEAKIERVFRAAEYWAQDHQAHNFPMRFDVIGILKRKGNEPEIAHFEDAYR